jgi:hypothetical protein
MAGGGQCATPHQGLATLEALARRSSSTRALSDGSAKSSGVLDRELEEEKSRDASGPRIRCPLCGLVAPQGRLLVV